MNTATVLVFALIAVVVVLSLARRRAPLPPPETEEGFGILSKPTIWWFVDADEPNARHWADFGGRNTRQPNRGYLQIALKKLYDTQGSQYNIQPLIGRAATLAQIDGANSRALQLPPDLWRSYVIANLAAQKGGLIVDGNSTLFIGRMHTPSASACLFGTDPDEPRVSAQTAVAPGPAPYVGWAVAPGHPAWTHAAQTYNALVEAGPQAWGAAQARRAFLTISEAQRELGATIVRGIDCSRRADGTKLQLDDVFGKTPLQMQAGTVYITYDGDDLARSHTYKWFLRLSPAQIEESSCAWCIAARAPVAA